MRWEQHFRFLSLEPHVQENITSSLDISKKKKKGKNKTKNLDLALTGPLVLVPVPVAQMMDMLID